MANKFDYAMYQGPAHYRIGNVYHLLNEDKTAVLQFKLASTFFRKTNSNAVKITVLVALSGAETSLDYFTENENYLHEALNTAREAKITDSATIYNRLISSLVKNKFAFTYRGEIEAKNKGAMKMYFVES